MKFAIFCEGHTERAVMGDLLARWLNPKLTERVGFKRVRFDGWHELVRDTPRKAIRYLADPDILGVVSILDLYGPTFYPDHLNTADDRRQWGMEEMRRKVSHEKYRHHFAVHEVEAWLLAQPDILPQQVRNRLPARAAQPEAVNFDVPPARLLNRLYREAISRDYKKVTEGTKLFARLDPETVYLSCPAFKALADDLLDLCPAEMIRSPE